MNDSSKYDFVFNRRRPLSEASKQKICDTIKANFGLDVMEIREVSGGYLFVGKYNMIIGDVMYDEISGGYKPFNYHTGVSEEITRKTKEVDNRKRKKKFKLDRKTIGVALTASAILALATIGAISLVDKVVAKDVDPIPITQQVSTITNAEDLILYSWANYAMNGVYDVAESSKYSYIQSLPEQLKPYYNDSMMNYFNYVDQVENGLPEELVGDLKGSYHGKYRNACYEFDEQLEEHEFGDLTFDGSPYAYAVVLDSDGNPLESTSINGEIYDENGNLVLVDNSAGYEVYVRACDVPKNDYTLHNLPADAEIVNGVPYVLDEHLDDFEITEEHGKSK